MPPTPRRDRPRSRSLVLATTLVAVSFSTTAPALAAPDWGKSFEPGAVAPHLPAGKTSFIVVGAGQPTPELQSATAAIEQALRKSGRANLVMNASGLGPVDGLDDAAIVKKCEALPVESIVIARVFPGSDDSQPQAVVTLYGKKGELKSAFSGAAGGAAAPAGSVEAEGTGVSAAAVAGVADVVRATERTSTAAQERYDREYLSVNQAGDSLFPFQGKYHREMSVPEFYRALGRHDLASAHEERKVLKILLMVAGLGAVAGGTLMAMSEPDNSAVVVVSVGCVAALAGLIIPNANGMEPAALRETVDKHNVNLKKKLELSAPGGSAATKVRGPSWMLAPFAARAGGGLALGGSF